jgi:hypothetical protein
MTEATTSNSNRWLLAWTLRRGHVDNSLVCRVAWLHKRDVSRDIARTTLQTHDEPRGVAFPSWLPVSSVCSYAPFLRNVHNLPQDRRFREANRKIFAHFETYENFSAQPTSLKLPDSADGRELGHAVEHRYQRSKGRLSRRQTATRKRVFSRLCRPETESRTAR